MKSLMIAIALFLAVPVLAHDMPTPKVSKDFESMKALEGNWEGYQVGDAKKEPIKVNYKLTSNNTTLMETMGAGTTHEMVSMYADHKKGITMTHFCAIGNQPIMDLKKADGKTFAFEMKGNKGIDDPKEMHMHSITLTLNDKDHLKQEWTNYVNGKKGEVVVFEFTRK